MEKTPQLEDGYTKIANEILEKLATINISPYQMRLLMCIFRKTYGWGKTEDWVSVSQFVEATGIGKTHVSRAKKELLLRNIVTSNGNKIAFQKDWRLWRELPKKVTVTSTGNKVTNSSNKVTSTGTYKRNYTKETSTKVEGWVTPTSTTPSLKGDVFAPKHGNKDINLILGALSRLNTTGKLDSSEAENRKHAQNLLKKYGKDEILRVIKALPTVPFWSGKVTSAGLLLRHFNAIINSLPKKQEYKFL